MWIEFGKTLFNLYSKVHVVEKFKKTKEICFNGSKKLKYVAIGGVNAVAMTIFYSMLLL
jgi:hypothetical protein